MSPSRAGTSGRWAWAEIDLDAISHNIGVVRRSVAPSEVWAVVKADGYGHGAAAVAGAALQAGAEGLCVALSEEGVELRRGGVDAPILVLSEQPPDQLAGLASHGHDGHQVHLKIDTGMHRAGCHPSDAVHLAAKIVASPALELAGVFTHLAVADDPAHPFTALQLQRFDDVLARLAASGIDAGLVHAANSAGALAHPAARRSMVRIGIATYGIAPGPGVAHLARELWPALSLRARVSFVRRLEAGERLSYGLRHTVDRATTIATVPIGYADGVPRRLFTAGCPVLLGGRFHPIAGVVTMDQLMVDVGDSDVAFGDEVVLIGEQGGKRITAEEWAVRLDTIGYEVVCGISKRIARHLR
ncbi:MAG: alr [Acidimicrobiaceae bacterium]|nr:MAG: alr [Acidimicrobiaceae bacterium]